MTVPTLDLAPGDLAPPDTDGSWNRHEFMAGAYGLAPSHQYVEVSYAEMAARLRAGEPLEELAAETGRAPKTLQQMLAVRGWGKTGQAEGAFPGWDTEELTGGYRPWMDGAPCARYDPEWWFPKAGAHNVAPKSVCAECPVRADCLEYALADPHLTGIWGGLTDRERQDLAKEERP